MNIAIVGGGPAGAYLGYCLAKGGVKATIFDDSHPREKPCGGGVSSLAIRKFPILHEVPVGKAETKEMRLISPKGRVCIVRGESESWAVSRQHLDGFLLNKAVQEGTTLIKERVEDVEKTGKGWAIRTKNRTYNADILVGADGARSLVRKKTIGPIPPGDLGVCYGCFAKGPNEESVIKFLPKIHGYAWIFPREDHMSIGVGVESKNGSLAKTEFEGFMKRYAIKAKPFSTWAAVLPFIKNPEFFDMKTSGKDWLVIGDAAGHVDPITAEGITYAMWSASIASEAILGGNLNTFEKEWRKEYGHNLKKGSAMRRFFFNDNILEISIKMAAKSNTYGKILYEVINSDQDYHTLEKRISKELPRILLEML